MKLYEINEEILRLIDQIEVDEETGEVKEGTEEIMKNLDALELQKKSILEYLAKLVMNIRAEAAAIKAEEIRLRNRRYRMEKKETLLLQILDRECAGEKTDLGIATFSYRKTSKLEVLDARKAVNWLKRRKLTNCFRVPEPEVAKTEVKKLIASGQKVPGCSVITDRSYSLK